MNVPFESQFESQESAGIARTAFGSVDTGARANVVNRTHRVVRQRAKLMQARRSRVRGLMVPMIICSALLLLIAFAVWSGLYQNPANAAELVQTDVAGPAAATLDANNHSVVALLWFVPACLAVPAMVLYRRRRESAVEKAGR
jgi:hypothetical protein